MEIGLTSWTTKDSHYKIEDGGEFVPGTPGFYEGVVCWRSWGHECKIAAENGLLA